MADFNAAYKIVRQNEGGYANKANDRGGETYKGISRKNFPGWHGWVLIDSYKKFTDFPDSLQHDVQLAGLVLSFFKVEFWDKMNLDLINSQPIAVELFDTAVNVGEGTAGMFLQRALNITNREGKDYPDLREDGQIGTKTISTINGHKNPSLILKILNILQGAKYIGIAEANSTQEEFISGWMNRVTI